MTAGDASELVESSYLRIASGLGVRTLAARAFAWAVGAIAISLLPACGLGDKQAMADRVIEAVDDTVAAGTATGTVGVTAEVVKVPAAMAALADQQGADFALPPRSKEVTFPVVLDMAAAQAQLLDGEEPFEVFDDLAIYGLRQTAADNDARPWARVDLDELGEGEAEIDPQQDAPIIAVNAISPTLLVDLAAGALTGSLEDRGTEDIAGVQATRYDANFDLDKTTQDTREDRYDEKRREAVESLFDVLTVKGRVHPGSVWLDGEGRLRQFVLRLQTEPEIDSVIEVALRLTLDEVGAPVTIAVPGQRDWLEVSNMVGFLRTVMPESMLLAAFATDDGGAVPQVELPTPSTAPTTVAP